MIAISTIALIVAAIAIIIDSWNGEV